jgi:DNA polymerase-3 subunit delta
MKLAWKQIEPFIKSPDPKARAILIYGPDHGLMKERTKIIGKKFVSDLNDPFNAVTLSSDIIEEDPARLNDEANAMSMMGGARLILIENGADKITLALKSYLEDPSSDNIVIIQAGALNPRSALRLLCEKAKNAVALPCYVEDERGVAGLIRDTMRDQNKRIDQDAVMWLAANIGGDRLKIRMELEKLSLYMGDKDHITLAIVQKCCGEAGAQDLETLIYSTAGGQKAETLKVFHKLLGEGVAEIAILRALQNHFRRLHYVNALVSEGAALGEALKKLSPPLFFKREDHFKAHLRKWNMDQSMAMIVRLNEIEAQTKQTGTPVETLCAQALLSISSR